jgi:tetratricopeptide (TPR) repeat protein
MSLRKASKSRPSVFLSSVISGLDRCRQRLSELIDNSGFECLNSTTHPDFGGSPRHCLALVDRADLYLGVFAERAGTREPLYDLPITELEFYHALSKKPVRIYLLPAKKRESHLDSFLQVWSDDFHGGVCFTPCEDETQLYNLVKRDLREFKRLLKTRQTHRWIPQLKLDAAHKELSSEVSEVLSSHFSPYAKFPLSSLSLEKAVEQIESFYENHKYKEALSIGASLYAPLSKHSPPDVDLWLRFLKIWCYSALWFGYVEGKYGALASALRYRAAVIQQRRFYLLGPAYSLVGLCYYTLGGRKHALQIINASSGRDDAHRCFQIALANDAMAYNLIKAGAPYLHRAYEYAALGEFGIATKDFEVIASLEKGNQPWHASILADLGRCYFLGGRRKKGMNYLEQALADVSSHDRHPLYVRTAAVVADAWMQSRNYKGAMELLEPLLGRAGELGLHDQKLKIGAALRLLGDKV